MDNLIDSRFERLEKALANLIDSVTKYHPSRAYAEELCAADTELSKGLEEVQTHQNNFLRIQELRQTSAALDTQIRETLSTLTSTRKDIVTTHTTKFPEGPNHPIRYEELLNYARRISKTTMPPAGTINGVGPASGAQTPVVESQPQSAVTPTGATPSQTQSPVAINGMSQQTSEQPTQQSTSTNITLPEMISQYLNPMSGQLFFPWPLEDKIRSGALASNQILAESGIEPKGYDPVAEEERKQKEEEERKEKEEKKKLEQEERERRLWEERERLRQERERQREKEQEEWRRSSVAGGPPGSAGPKSAAPVEKKQFQFADLDDMDDDDD
ncbi:vitamin-D-receptor interacting mediator subunit 4-domain-containing protein [Stachybotrys elegans]|uniref:Mediator of RNA polymerase II transcription subunit 4 n=1 Tax=Stachybotrys elegans TaxID=80388 RepID=A0A8K0SMI0_9HYPO|nr:vitamin-D-receptor interacting mediator subunit 4-domain-containing protein [Stachybotrys elegans]